MRFSLLFLTALTACLPSTAIDGEVATYDGLSAAEAPVEAGSEVEEGSWLIRVEHIDDTLLAQLDAMGAGELVPVPNAPDTYRFSTEAAPADVTGSLSSLPLTTWIEPVIIHQALAAPPNDPLFDLQWHHGTINTLSGWDASRGEGVVVAVLDTGVHGPDVLADSPINVLPQQNYVDSTLGDDDVGHGTHVANTIAQNADNGLSGAGIAPGATILPVRVLGPYGGTSDDIASGIRYAVDNGADIINLSLGSPLYSSVIDEACQYAADHDVLIFAASGNGGSDRFVDFPAALDNTIAVGAVGPDGVAADYSSGGSELDLVAPGGVHYDYDRNGYADGILAETVFQVVGVEGYEDGWYGGAQFQSGTSMATAVASGSAAILLGAGVPSSEVLPMLQNTAVDAGTPGWDTTYGAGIIDLEAALEGYTPILETVHIDDAALDSLQVSEFMANPSSCANDTCEWVEVTNTGEMPILLDGLQMWDATGTVRFVTSERAIYPGEHAVLGRGDAEGWEHPEVQPDGFYGSIGLNNTGDTLTLANIHGAFETISYDADLAESGISAERTEEGWSLATHALDSGELATPGF